MTNFYWKDFFWNCVRKEIQLNFQQKSNNLTKMRLRIHCSKNLTLPFYTHETKECFYHLECTTRYLRKKDTIVWNFEKSLFKNWSNSPIFSLMMEIKKNTSKWLVNSTSFFPVAILPRNEAPAAGSISLTWNILQNISRDFCHVFAHIPRFFIFILNGLVSNFDGFTSSTLCKHFAFYTMQTRKTTIQFFFLQKKKKVLY